MSKLILEIEKGRTLCLQCPFADSQFCQDNLDNVAEFDCSKYNLSTIEIKQIED